MSNKRGIIGFLEGPGGGRLICSLLLLLAVAGCSGGGDGNGSTAAAQSGTAPEAAFTVSTDIGSYPLQVAFDASVSTDSDGSIARYDWDFGDGDTAEGVSEAHTYSAPGTYTAKLTVSDEGGLTGSATHVIEVKPLYSLSGTVTPAGYVVSDSDVNDPNAEYTANDSFSEAQAVHAPCSISGYVNVAGAGSDGRSYDAGDPVDFYRVDLTDGMRIALYMAEDPGSNQMNLHLYDVSGGWVATAATDAENDVVELPVNGTGTYYVQVEAVSDGETASAYTLTIGLFTGSALRGQLRTSDAYVPGEVLVRFEADAGDEIAEIAGIPGKLSPLGFTTRPGDRGRDRLLKLPETGDRNALFKRLGIQRALSRSLAFGRMDDETRARVETLWMVRALRNRPGVVFAEPNYIRTTTAEPDDPLYTRQWHYPLINLPDAWGITRGSSEVVVAVIDTGVLLDHPDLQGQLVSGYDFISDPSVSGDGDARDSNPDDPGDSGGIGGSSFHGTHVAGTIAALTDNHAGVAGVAWNAKVMPLRAIGAGGGYDSDIADAIRYAAGLEVDGVASLAEPVAVINLSLGSSSYSRTLESACAAARAEGVIIVAAAGNDGSSTPSYPAAFDGVVSVSAVGIDGSLASYSNYGETIDVAAPGGDSGDEDGDGYPDSVLSTCGDDSSGTIEMVYAFYNGTSMAAPHVAGVAALMKSLYPGLTPDQFDALLQGGYLTRDLGDRGRDDEFGWGLIDAYKAVSVVKDGGIGGSLPEILSVSPSVLSFGASLSGAEVTVENSGGGSLSLADGSPTWSADWLEVTASGDVGGDGLGTYVVAVDRAAVAVSGTYYDTVTFTASDGAEEAVSVSMRKSSGDESSSTGFYYILLLDPETQDTVDQVETGGVDGVYEYSFSGLSYGDKVLVYAGTDADNDYYLCGDGEACGAYLSLDDPVELTVTGDLTGIEFSTDILYNLSSGTNFQGTMSSISLHRDVSKQVIR